MEKRTLIAVILSIAVLIIFQFFYQPEETTYFKPQSDPSNKTSEDEINNERFSDTTKKDLTTKKTSHTLYFFLSSIPKILKDYIPLDQHKF